MLTCARDIVRTRYILLIMSHSRRPERSLSVGALADKQPVMLPRRGPNITAQGIALGTYGVEFVGALKGRNKT